MKNKINRNYKYKFVLLMPFIAVLLLFSSSLCIGAFRFFSEREITYFLLDLGVFSGLFIGAIVSSVLVLSLYFAKMLGKDSDFSARALESNINAEKTTKNCILICCVIYAFSVSFFILSFYSRVEADSQKVTEYNLFEEDVVLFEYDDAESVDVYLEWRDGGRHNSGYATVIEVETNNGLYKFWFEGFDDDYYLVYTFLNKFDESIVNVDKSMPDDTERIIKYDIQEEIFNKIYK